MPSSTITRGNVLLNLAIAPSLTPVAIAANITAEQTFTITGLLVNDIVRLSSTVAQTAGVIINSSRVSAADTLSVSFGNLTAGSLTPVAGIYSLLIHRPENLPLPVVAV